MGRKDDKEEEEGRRARGNEDEAVSRSEGRRSHREAREEQAAEAARRSNTKDEEEDEEEEEEQGKEGEQEEKGSDSEENASGSSQEVSWIQWFCSLQGNEFFTEVSEDFVQDQFNLTGLGSLVPYYDYALDIILDIETPQDEELTEEQQELVESAAEILYGLIHARYILTQRGMLQMVNKFKRLEFGRCPRVLCGGQAVLPVGQSDQPQKHTVKVYCPRCCDIFYPRSSKNRATDGAYFGTTFPHLTVMAYADLMPEPCQPYVPRIYGFKIHADSPARNQHNRKTIAGDATKSDAA